MLGALIQSNAEPQKDHTHPPRVPFTQHAVLAGPSHLTSSGPALPCSPRLLFKTQCSRSNHDKTSRLKLNTMLPEDYHSQYLQTWQGHKNQGKWRNWCRPEVGTELWQLNTGWGSWKREGTLVGGGQGIQVKAVVLLVAKHHAPDKCVTVTWEANNWGNTQRVHWKSPITSLQHCLSIQLFPNELYLK